MNNREIYFSSKKIESKYINDRVILNLLRYVNDFNDDLTLFLHFDEPCKNEKLFNKLFNKILDGFPLQYALHQSYFLNKTYYVDENVLIPRPETEQLVIESLKLIKEIFKNNEINVIDIGTGSGVIIDSLIRLANVKYALGIDIGDKVIEIAKRNCPNGEFKKLDILDDNVKFDKDYHVVISNPPYISEIDTIDEQVYKYEPKNALLAYPRTKFYKEILTKFSIQTNKTIFCFEIGENMVDELKEIIKEIFPYKCKYYFKKDIYEKIRFLFVIINDDD